MDAKQRQRRQREWESRYCAGQTHWDRGAISPALRYWLNTGAIPDGRILVPGCGHGYEIGELVRAGRQVTAVDIAAPPVLHLLAQLAESALHARVIQADLLDWAPAEPFAAVYEQTCLCALDPDDWQEYASRLANWLLPGGRLFALFMQTGRPGGPPFDCRPAAMRELFTADRWDWPEQAPLRIPHPTGLSELGYVLTRRP